MNKNIFFFEIILIILIIGLSIGLFIYLPSKTFPADDALILFRYAEIFAETGVIAYNYGKLPVEGATDFLWMIILAVLNKFGIKTWAGSLFISYISLLATAYIIYKLLETKKRVLFFLLIIFFLMFKTNLSALLGFSTLFFGLSILLCFYFEIKNKINYVFILAFLTCLIRPDGFALVLPVIANVFFKKRIKISKIVFKFALFFLLPGIIYFIWRFKYFGYLFPLPFYIKYYNKIINKESFIENIIFNLPFFIIILINYIYLLKNKININKNEIAFLILYFVFPFLFYSKITLLQNVCNRFQHPFVIINFIILVLIWKKYFLKKIIFFSLTSLIIYSTPYFYKAIGQIWLSQYENIYKVAFYFSKSIPKALFLTTEAGIVPYYTKWETIDAFGLNTPAYTKKIITSEDVKKLSPDIVLINYMWDLYNIIDYAKEENKDAQQKTWQGMIHNIVKGLDDDNYNIILLPVYNCDEIKKIKKEKFYRFMYIGKNFEYYYDKMYYCFFIKKNFNYASVVENILYMLGGLSYKNFKNNIRPTIEQQLRSLNLLPNVSPHN
ncbi:MAG: hypothetical protein NC935_03735 [Candidatus Omnitrophica bacterium]|nr:hypothetical protein [Candidatus Omnitrophota bacterium]